MQLADSGPSAQIFAAPHSPESKQKRGKSPLHARNGFDCALSTVAFFAAAQSNCTQYTSPGHARTPTACIAAPARQVSSLGPHFESVGHLTARAASLADAVEVTDAVGVADGAVVDDVLGVPAEASGSAD
jgi:hypothetical protein